MEKWGKIPIIMCILFLYCVIGYTMSVSNIAEPLGGFLKFSLGVELDNVSSKSSEVESSRYYISRIPLGFFSETSWLPAGTNINTSSVNNILKCTLGILPILDVFAFIGQSNTNWLLYPYRFDSSGGFIYGAGGKIKIAETSNALKFVIGVRHSFSILIGTMKINGIDFREILHNKVANAPDASISYISLTRFSEEQYMFYINKSFKTFSPYVGIKYSNVSVVHETEGEAKTENFIHREELKFVTKSVKNIGLFLGTDVYLISRTLYLNIETRVLNESAISLGLGLRL